MGIATTLTLPKSLDDWKEIKDKEDLKKYLIDKGKFDWLDDGSRKNGEAVLMEDGKMTALEV